MQALTYSSGKLIFHCTFLSYTIKIICPEESLFLVASTPQEKVNVRFIVLLLSFCNLGFFKPTLMVVLYFDPAFSLQNKWLRSLNQAVDLVLGGAAQGSSPGVTAAVCRTASYKFVSDERFKDAQYSGGWMAGRVHGRSDRHQLLQILKNVWS